MGNILLLVLASSTQALPPDKNTLHDQAFQPCAKTPDMDESRSHSAAGKATCQTALSFPMLNPAAFGQKCHPDKLGVASVWQADCPCPAKPRLLVDSIQHPWTQSTKSAISGVLLIGTLQYEARCPSCCSVSFGTNVDASAMTMFEGWNTCSGAVQSQE